MRNIDVNDIKNVENPYLIDVRTNLEQLFGMIDGAISMPMDTVEANLDKLPKDREIYVVCKSGNRSRQVCEFLDSKGYKTVNLLGGMSSYIK